MGVASVVVVEGTGRGASAVASAPACVVLYRQERVLCGHKGSLRGMCAWASGVLHVCVKDAGVHPACV